jgi:hypothetical protein
MALNSYSIPNLIQGIGQQSDAQHDPTQGERQVYAEAQNASLQALSTADRTNVAGSLPR